MNRQIATFYLGETVLGVDILLIKEIYRHMGFTPIPGSSEHMRGLINLRGRVVTVLDLDYCLCGESRDGDDQRLLILKTDGEILQYQREGLLIKETLGDDIVGLVIDRMSDVLDIAEEEILPPPQNLKEVDRELIEGVIKLKDKLVLNLDVTSLLNKLQDQSLELLESSS